METFWQLFKESTIVQALITITLLFAIVYMYVSHQTVPDTLAQAFMLVLGFYFGSKSTVQFRHLTQEIQRMAEENHAKRNL